MSLPALRLRYLSSIGVFLPLVAAAACGKTAGGADGSTATERTIGSMPSCPNGGFCVTASPTPPASAAPAPYGHCATTATHPNDVPDSTTAVSYRSVTFSPDKTATAMAKDPKACCYTWVIPCPGGRAFRDSDGTERVASPTRRDDWMGAPIAVEALSDAERAARAKQWTADALYEHASVASFAQLTLDLLAHGAPPALVEQAQRAALDEIRHAQIAFAFASAYAGHPVGPGPLLASPTPARSLLELARTTFRDACIGESLAAAKLRERAATEPALASIAEDEERHAELAWSIVAWAVATGGSAVASALASELPRREGAPAALVEVVLPCAEAILAAARRVDDSSLAAGAVAVTGEEVLA